MRIRKWSSRRTVLSDGNFSKWQHHSRFRKGNNFKSHILVAPLNPLTLVWSTDYPSKTGRHALGDYPWTKQVPLVSNQVSFVAQSIVSNRPKCRHVIQTLRLWSEQNVSANNINTKKTNKKQVDLLLFRNTLTQNLFSSTKTRSIRSCEHLSSSYTPARQLNWWIRSYPVTTSKTSQCLTNVLLTSVGALVLSTHQVASGQTGRQGTSRAWARCLHSYTKSRLSAHLLL